MAIRFHAQFADVTPPPAYMKEVSVLRMQNLLVVHITYTSNMAEWFNGGPDFRGEGRGPGLPPNR